MEACVKLGVKYLTLYTFSMENWQRPVEEVDNLMTLMRYYLKNEASSLHKNNIKVEIIGNIKKLDEMSETTYNLYENKEFDERTIISEITEEQSLKRDNKTNIKRGHKNENK
jgi:undecaprenyl diphosphate synthase